LRVVLRGPAVSLVLLVLFMIFSPA
jgi:hypothetical protein